MASLLCKSEIKKLIHDGGKRIQPAAMDALNACVREKIQAMIREHDGGAKTIDPSLVHYTFTGKKQL